MIRNETIYLYFKENRNIIDTAYEGTTNKQLKANFIKRWGPYLNGKDIKYIYTKTDEENFEIFKEEFLKSINTVKQYQFQGFKKNEIIKKMRTEIQKEDKISIDINLKNYENIDEILIAHKTNISIFREALDQFNNNVKLSYIYYYGVNINKCNIEEIADHLNISEYLVKSYIRKVEMEIDNYIKIIEEKNNQDSMLNIKETIYDFFDYSKKENIKKIINMMKETDKKKYEMIIMQYGTNFDELNKNYKTKYIDEKIKTECIKKINKYLKQLEKGTTIEEIKEQRRYKKRAKISFFEYFDEVDKPLVIEILNMYKEINHYYYDLLYEMYGKEFKTFAFHKDFSKAKLTERNNAVARFRVIIEKLRSGIPLSKIKTNITKTVTIEPIRKINIIELINKYPFIKQIDIEDYPVIIPFLNNNEIEMNQITDKCLIKYLNLFDNFIDIFIGLVIRGNYSITEIIENSFLKDEFQLLTNKEQEYIKLKLSILKLRNHDLFNKQMINDLFGEEINDYEIMTKSDKLNSLNKILKKNL